MYCIRDGDDQGQPDDQPDEERHCTKQRKQSDCSDETGAISYALSVHQQQLSHEFIRQTINFEKGVDIYCVAPDGSTKRVILKSHNDSIAWGNLGSSKFLSIPMIKVDSIAAGLPSKLVGNGWDFVENRLFHMSIGSKSAPFLCSSVVERDVCMEILIDFKRRCVAALQ